jgi:hypothetical protein
MAVNEKGESIDGVYTSPDGIVVEFYKNWIYVRDEKSWAEGSGWAKPTVMQVKSGSLAYKDIHILALRGPQGGVFAAIWTEKYDEEGEGESKRVVKKVTGMVGCGVYGFDKDKWVGVTRATRSWWQKKLRAFKMRTEKVRITEYPTEGKKRVRIHKSRVKRFDLDVPDELRVVKFNKALRFNQGDRYFAQHLGEKIPATEAGEQTEPVMTEIISNMEAVDPEPSCRCGDERDLVMK